MIRACFIILVIIFLTGCDGYYSATGKVTYIKNGKSVPADSVYVRVWCGEDWQRGSQFTDSNGYFELSGLTDPAKRKYYLTFSKKGFITDSIMVQGSRGKTIINHDHTIIPDL